MHDNLGQTIWQFSQIKSINKKRYEKNVKKEMPEHVMKCGKVQVQTLYWYTVIIATEFEVSRCTKWALALFVSFSIPLH